MPWLPKRSVVVPFDFSEDSLGAVATALQLVETAAQVHVVHVLPKVEPSDPEYLWMTAAPEARREHAEQALAEKLGDPKFRDVRRHVAFGDPGHEIAELAKQLAAELIVLPSHGRTGLQRLLIGSTAERVVRLAHCPVLVLRK